jgi:hypothetical protein
VGLPLPLSNCFKVLTATPESRARVSCVTCRDSRLAFTVVMMSPECIKVPLFVQIYVFGHKKYKKCNKKHFLTEKGAS